MEIFYEFLLPEVLPVEWLAFYIYVSKTLYVPCLQGHEGSRSQVRFAIVKRKPNGTLNA